MKSETNKKKSRVVRVIWHDAVAETGWISTEEAGKVCRIDRCTSIGYLVHQDPVRLVLACTKSEDEYNAIINIPINCILDVEEFSL